MTKIRPQLSEKISQKLDKICLDNFGTIEKKRSKAISMLISEYEFEEKKEKSYLVISNYSPEFKSKPEIIELLKVKKITIIDIKKKKYSNDFKNWNLIKQF